MKALFLLLMIVAAANAQYYVWVDTVAVTTAAIDSAFLYRWEECTLKFWDCAGWLKIGAPDTVKWADRDWYPASEGEPVEIQFRTPLTRLEFKAASGSGIIVFTGYKRQRQWK